MAVNKYAAQSVVERIQAIEDRADQCFENLQLLQKNSWNVATWASLAKAIELLEGNSQAADAVLDLCMD
jgi:hypothetical protein